MATRLGSSVQALGEYWWDCDKLLGRGSYGHVFLGRRESDGLEVAVKRIKHFGYPEQDKKVMANFERERSIGLQLAHRNVVRIFATGTVPSLSREAPPHAVLVMEYCNRKDLDNFLTLYPLMIDRVASDFFFQMCEGLSYLNGLGIAHRDIKPSNIMIHKDPDQDRAVFKICDFGLSRVLGPDVETLTAGLGTPVYMAPEVFGSLGPRFEESGSESLSGSGSGAARDPTRLKDSSSDLWSLGVVLAKCVTDKFLFAVNVKVDSPSQIVDNITQAADSYDYAAILRRYSKLTGAMQDMFAFVLRSLLTVNPKERISFKALHEIAKSLTLERYHVVLPDACTEVNLYLYPRNGGAFDQEGSMGDLQAALSRTTGTDVADQCLVPFAGTNVLSDQSPVPRSSRNPGRPLFMVDVSRLPQDGQFVVSTSEMPELDFEAVDPVIEVDDSRPAREQLEASLRTAQQVAEEAEGYLQKLQKLDQYAHWQLQATKQYHAMLKHNSQRATRRLQRLGDAKGKLAATVEVLFEGYRNEMRQLHERVLDVDVSSSAVDCLIPSVDLDEAKLNRWAKFIEQQVEAMFQMEGTVRESVEGCLSQCARLGAGLSAAEVDEAHTLMSQSLTCVEEEVNQVKALVALLEGRLADNADTGAVAGDADLLAGIVISQKSEQLARAQQIIRERVRSSAEEQRRLGGIVCEALRPIIPHLKELARVLDSEDSDSFESVAKAFSRTNAEVHKWQAKHREAVLDAFRQCVTTSPPSSPPTGSTPATGSAGASTTTAMAPAGEALDIKQERAERAARIAALKAELEAVRAHTAETEDTFAAEILEHRAQAQAYETVIAGLEQQVAQRIAEAEQSSNSKALLLASHEEETAQLRRELEELRVADDPTASQFEFVARETEAPATAAAAATNGEAEAAAAVRVLQEENARLVEAVKSLTEEGQQREAELAEAGRAVDEALCGADRHAAGLKEQLKASQAEHAVLLTQFEARGEQTDIASEKATAQRDAAVADLATCRAKAMAAEASGAAAREALEAELAVVRQELVALKAQSDGLNKALEQASEDLQKEERQKELNRQHWLSNHQVLVRIYNRVTPNEPIKCCEAGVTPECSGLRPSDVYSLVGRTIDAKVAEAFELKDQLDEAHHVVRRSRLQRDVTDHVPLSVFTCLSGDIVLLVRRGEDWTVFQDPATKVARENVTTSKLNEAPRNAHACLVAKVIFRDVNGDLFVEILHEPVLPPHAVAAAAAAAAAGSGPGSPVPAADLDFDRDGYHSPSTPFGPLA